VSVYRQFRATVILSVQKWPAEEGTATYRFSARASAPAAGFIEGRVPRGGYGELLRNLSSIEGDYDVDVWRFDLIDTDRVIRGLLREPETRQYLRWEVRAELISEEGAIALATPRVLWRGKVSRVDLLDELHVRLETRDLLATDLDRELPLWKFGEDWADQQEFPVDAMNLVVPLLYGENSDHLAELPDGTIAEKGLVPVQYVGKYMIDPGGPGIPGTAPIYLDPPTNLTCTVFNPSGRATHSVRCGVTAVTNFGETTLSNIVTVSNYPKLTFADSEVVGTPIRVEWEWDAPSPAGEVIGYRMYVLDESSTGTPRYRLDMNYNPAGNASTTYTDDGDDAHDKRMYPPPPTSNTAQVAEGEPGVPGTGPVYWDTYVVCAGAIGWDGVEIYASNVLGAPPERALMDPGVWGVDFIGPNEALWPHPDPWVVRNGRRYSVFYGRGPRSLHHINGTVSIALNASGYREFADATGEVIDQAFFAVQHLLMNWAGLDVDQTTYKNDDDWLGLPRFTDGVARLQSSRFTACQDLTIARLATTKGYLARFVINQPMTIRDVLRHAGLSFGCFWRNSHHGQLGPVMIDETMSPSAGALWRDRIEIKRWLQPIVDERICTRLPYVYDWDAELQDWREHPEPIVDRDLADELGGAVEYDNAPLELRLTGDEATAEDVANRLFRLLRRPRRVQPVVLSLMGLATDLGDVRRFTHYNGPGSLGDLETPAFVASHRVSLSNEEVTIGLFDLTELFEGLGVLPMVTTIELGGSHISPVTSTSYVDVPGQLKPEVRAGDFYNWTTEIVIQRWTTGGTVQVRVVDEDDTVIAEMPVASSNTTIGVEETLTVTLPATRKAIRMQAKVSVDTVEGFALGTLRASRS